MGKMLLGLAAAVAVTALAAPASAGTPEEPFVGFPEAKGNLGTFTNGANVNVGGVGFGHHPGFGDDRFKRFGRGSGGSSHGVWINGGQWAQYNNEAFKSDGYNDWWHDRPDRAYPAWMRNNQNCARQWYSGSTLRC